MLSLKEKLAEKLSRVLADSPSSPSPPSPVAKSEYHATPYTEDLTSPKKSSFSSYVLSFLPSATANPNSPSFGQTLQPLPPESLPVRWNSGEWEYKQVVLSDGENDDKNENKYGSKFEETVDYDEKLKCYNGYQEKNLKSLYSDEYQKRLSDKSEFISLNLFDFLESSLPSTIKGSHWVLLYSTWKHGISLRTLLRRSADLPGPCLLIVGDLKGATFGGLLECPLKPTPKRKYQVSSFIIKHTANWYVPNLCITGTNISDVCICMREQAKHLFTLQDMADQGFLDQLVSIGANRYFYMCLNDALAFGGGGNFALCLDEDLLHGTSGPCETFGNECLAHDTEFELKNVELWGFTYMTRHLAN